jgi:energy-converting hydrogenase A subunit M
LQRILAKLAKKNSLAIQLCVLSDLCGYKKVSRKACKEFTQNSQRKTLASLLCVLSDLCGYKKKFHAKLAKEKPLAIQFCVLSDLCGFKKSFTKSLQRILAKLAKENS